MRQLQSSTTSAVLQDTACKTDGVPGSVRGGQFPESRWMLSHASVENDAFFEKLPAIIRPCTFRFYWVVDACHVKQTEACAPSVFMGRFCLNSQPCRIAE